jgi:hypothetical protein
MMSEINEVRCQRDLARTERDRLKAENERLSMLLGYAKAAAREEYLLRTQNTSAAEPK